MLGFGQVRDANFGPLATAADAWTKLAGQSDPLGEQIRDRTVNPVRSGAWTGKAADSARPELERFIGEFDVAAVEAVSIAQVLRRSHGELTEIQRRLRALVAEIEGNNLQINPQGIVLVPQPASGAEHDPDVAEHQKKQWDRANDSGIRLNGLVQEAVGADGRLTQALRQLLPKEVMPVHQFQSQANMAGAVADLRMAAGEPPKDLKQLPAWWTGLDPAVRAVLMDKDAKKLIDAGILDPTVPWDAPKGGSGEHGTRNATPKELAWYLAVKAAADISDIAGMPNASDLLNHYLGNSGSPYEVDVEQIMKDVPRFQGSVETRLSRYDEKWSQEALAAYQKNGGLPVSIPVETGWTDQGDNAGKPQGFNFSADKETDWFRAIGSMNYNVVGVVNVRPDANGNPVVSMDYQVHIRDRYDWDGDQNGDGDTSDSKSIDVPVPFRDPVVIKDSSMGALHQAGLAQEFTTWGNSDTMTRTLPGGPLNPSVPSSPMLDPRLEYVVPGARQADDVSKIAGLR